MTKPDEIESEIADQIKAAKIRLRFDKVVRRLSARLKTALKSQVPDHESVVFTVTAPIRKPSETAAALEDLFREGAPGNELRKIIHGNKIRVRPVSRVAADMPKVVFLVHNPDSDPKLILDIAESRLRQKSP